MEICTFYEPTYQQEEFCGLHSAECGNDLPLEGISIQRFHEEREAFDEASTIIWRVEHDKAIPQDEQELVKLVGFLDWTCSPESYRCNHEHDCCGCAFTMSFDVEYVGKNLAYIRKQIGLNY
mgnify:FL=1|jgi:hypothetical protein|tara:strand:- start:113 stop:478 length:366 start_codon:yes stop_codon:yes gene_type:complete